jgi:hypothetical protein
MSSSSTQDQPRQEQHTTLSDWQHEQTQEHTEHHDGAADGAGGDLGQQSHEDGRDADNHIEVSTLPGIVSLDGCLMICPANPTSEIPHMTSIHPFHRLPRFQLGMHPHPRPLTLRSTP